VDATPGVAGGYRLGTGAALPPLLLDDEEAVAVAISLHTATTGSVAGLEETALRALTKLQQMMPSRLRHRISAFHATTVALAGPGSAQDQVDPDLLTAIAAACRDQRRLRLLYPGRDGVTTREVEPHRLVHTPRRWYLVAWDLTRGDWRTFRVDRIQGPPGPPGARFTPRPLPAEDVAAYVSQSIASAPYRYQARILFCAPLAEVAGQTSPTAGRLEAAGPDACILHAGSNSLDELALYVGLKGLEFRVLEPTELVPVLRSLAERLGRAAEVSLRPSRSAKLADMYDSHTGPARDQLGLVRHIGGDDQHRCDLVGRLGLLGLFYRGRGHHRIHRLLRCQSCGTNQLACPATDGFADRLHDHSGQHAVHFGITAASAQNLGENRRRGQHAVPVVVGHLQPDVHGAVGGRLRDSLVVENHDARGTDPGPPAAAHTRGHSERAAATSSSVTGPCTRSSSATRSPKRSCSSWRSRAWVT
jgi:predicted DNA-binding transcriptional regulator YafY